MQHFRLDYFLEPYAELINQVLPLVLLLALLIYFCLHLHVILRVTPRVDHYNGFKTTRLFKINQHQTAVYRRCFTTSDKKIKKLFKVEKYDRLFFQCDKYLPRFVVAFVALGCSFLSYTHTLVF